MNEVKSMVLKQALSKETHELVRYGALTFVAMLDHQEDIESFTNTFAEYMEGGVSFRPTEKALNRVHEGNDEVHARVRQVQAYLNDYPSQGYLLKQKLGYSYEELMQEVDEHLQLEITVIGKAVKILGPYC